MSKADQQQVSTPYLEQIVSHYLEYNQSFKNEVNEHLSKQPSHLERSYLSWYSGFYSLCENVKDDFSNFANANYTGRVFVLFMREFTQKIEDALRLKPNE